MQRRWLRTSEVEVPARAGKTKMRVAKILAVHNFSVARAGTTKF
jgi:hypothetical protein